MAVTLENQLVVYVNCPNGNLLQLLVLTDEVQQQFATYCSLATYCIVVMPIPGIQHQSARLSFSGWVLIS